MTDFGNELSEIINKHSMEYGSETPDFILAEMLERTLLIFTYAIDERDRWYRRKTSEQGDGATRTPNKLTATHNIGSQKLLDRLYELAQCISDVRNRLEALSIVKQLRGDV